jgi:hypothetical protein
MKRRKSPSSRGNCCSLRNTILNQKGTSKVNDSSASHVIVESGGSGVVAHVGLHALGCFADRLGLGDSLSSHIPAAG